MLFGSDENQVKTVSGDLKEQFKTLKGRGRGSSAQGGVASLFCRGMVGGQGVENCVGAPVSDLICATSNFQGVK